MPGRARVKRGDLSRSDLIDSLTATFAHWDHADAFFLKERTLRRLGLLYEP